MNNTIELIGHYGGDKTHALSAWTSTYRNLTPDKEQRIPELLLMLASAGHHTPFEKSALHFLIRCDDATHIHLLKHRVGVSINAESARYKELKEPTCYIPDDWPEKDQDLLQRYFNNAAENYQTMIEELTPTLGRKRAKESARYFLPKSNQLTLDVMFNWRSFAHFLGLRYKTDAQKEIYDLAEKSLDLVRSIDNNPFEATIRSFGYQYSL